MRVPLPNALIGPFFCRLEEFDDWRKELDDLASILGSSDREAQPFPMHALSTSTIVPALEKGVKTLEPSVAIIAPGTPVTLTTPLLCLQLRCKWRLKQRSALFLTNSIPPL